MPEPTPVHLCPVCTMPAPLGLVHCSLACEEKDPVPIEEWPSDFIGRTDRILPDPAPEEGASE